MSIFWDTIVQLMTLSKKNKYKINLQTIHIALMRLFHKKWQVFM